MSRVYPLPSALRKKIIDLLCAAHLRNNLSITAPKSHLARILLGRPIPDPGRVAPRRFFDTYDFPLTRDRAELLGIDVVNAAVENGSLVSANVYEGQERRAGCRDRFRRERHE